MISHMKLDHLYMFIYEVMLLKSDVPRNMSHYKSESDICLISTG